MKKYVLIVAGGKGLRMGSELPKQFIPLNGRPLLMHTLSVFNEWDATAEIILVLPESHHAYWSMLCKELNFNISHQVVSGGDTRFQSVMNGLGLIKESGLVAVHDGVRPFVSSAVIADCFTKAAEDGAAIPVIPVIDSMRKKKQNGSCPVDRQEYCAVQTPQVFISDLLITAYNQAGSDSFTDDASVFEAAGGRISLVDGNRENIKITTATDLLYAKVLLES